MKGDRTNLNLSVEDRAMIHRAKMTGVPVITILISGRPLILDAALELPDFALEEIDTFDGLVNLVDQALFFEQVEIELADKLRHLHAGARKLVAAVQIGLLL